MILKKYLLPFVIMIIASVFIVRIECVQELFDINNYCKVKSNIINLVTVSTILMGFAFNVLGLLYGFDASDFVKKMQTTDYVVKRARMIVYCLLILGFSSLSGIILMLLNVPKVYKYIYLWAVFSLFYGIILFVLSTWKVYQLIEKVHNYDRDSNMRKYDVYKENKK